MWSPLPNKLSKVHCWRFVSKGAIEDGTVDKPLTNLHRVCPRDSGTVKSLHDVAGVSGGLQETITSTHQRDLWEDHVREDSKKRQRAPSASGGGWLARVDRKCQRGQTRVEVEIDHCVCEAYQEQGERRIKQIKLITVIHSWSLPFTWTGSRF